MRYRPADDRHQHPLDPRDDRRDDKPRDDRRAYDERRTRDERHVKEDRPRRDEHRSSDKPASKDNIMAGAAGALVGSAIASQLHNRRDKERERTVVVDERRDKPSSRNDPTKEVPVEKRSREDKDEHDCGD